MNKATLTLLTASLSLTAMILITNPANASTVINPVISAPTTQIVNLNRAPSVLNIMTKESNPIQDHLSCSCATCQVSPSQI